MIPQVYAFTIEHWQALAQLGGEVALKYLGTCQLRVRHQSRHQSRHQTTPGDSYNQRSATAPPTCSNLPSQPSPLKICSVLPCSAWMGSFANACRRGWR